MNKWNFNFNLTHFDPDQIKLCTQVYEALKSMNINLEDTEVPEHCVPVHNNMQCNG